MPGAVANVDAELAVEALLDTALIEADWVLLLATVPPVPADFVLLDTATMMPMTTNIPMMPRQPIPNFLIIANLRF